MPSRGARIGLNFTWTFAGRALYASVQWIVVIVLARLGGTSEVGMLALGLAIVNPIMVFSQLSLRPLKATASGKDYEPAAYFSLRVVATVLAAALCLAIILISDLDKVTAAATVFILAGKVLENISDVLYGFHLSLERHDVMSTSLILRSLLGLLAVIATYLLTRNLPLALAGQALAWGAVLALYDLPRTATLLDRSGAGAPGGFWRWEPVAWTGLVKLGLPLGLAGFWVSAITNLPRYFVEWSLGRDPLGVFAALAYFVTFASLLANVSTQTVAPRLGRALAAEDPSSFFAILGRVRAVTLLSTIAGVVVCAFAGEWIVVTAYGPALAATGPLLAWVAVACGLTFATTFSSYGLIAARRVHGMQWSLVAATSVCLVTCWAAVERFGLRGALMGWIAGLLVQFLSFEWCLRRVRSDRLPAGRATPGTPS